MKDETTRAAICEQSLKVCGSLPDRVLWMKGARWAIAYAQREIKFQEFTFSVRGDMLYLIGPKGGKAISNPKLEKFWEQL